MPLKVIQRGNAYHIYGTHHGVAVRRSAKTTDRREAEAVREATERRIFEEQVLGKDRSRGFAEAVAAYLERGEDRFILKVLDAFQDTPLRSISQADLDRRAKQAYPTAKNSTLNRQFYTPFIAVMNYAARQGWCDVRPWERPKQPQGRTDWRTPEEIEAFLQAAPWHLARNVMIYVGTMMRASEGLGLHERDVSHDGTEITVWESKGGYSRKIEVLSRAQPLLWSPRGQVVCDALGEPYGDHNALNKAIGRVCAANKLPRFSCHVLRHTGATWRQSLEGNLPRLMAIGGWRSLTMVQRYAHAATRDLPARLERYGWGL